jgi:hypothetical protein
VHHPLARSPCTSRAFCRLGRSLKLTHLHLPSRVSMPSFFLDLMASLSLLYHCRPSPPKQQPHCSYDTLQSRSASLLLQARPLVWPSFALHADLDPALSLCAPDRHPDEFMTPACALACLSAPRPSETEADRYKGHLYKREGASRHGASRAPQGHCARAPRACAWSSAGSQACPGHGLET